VIAEVIQNGQWWDEVLVIAAIMYGLVGGFSFLMCLLDAIDDGSRGSFWRACGTFGRAHVEAMRAIGRAFARPTREPHRRQLSARERFVRGEIEADEFERELERELADA
jgi:hypothetical protein